MDCPLCHHTENHVTQSRDRDGGVQRQRQCDRCGHRWRTVELPIAEVEHIRRIKGAWSDLSNLIGAA